MQQSDGTVITPGILIDQIYTSGPDAMAALGNVSGLKPGTAVFIGHPVPLGERLPIERTDVALEGVGKALSYSVCIEAVG